MQTELTDKLRVAALWAGTFAIDTVLLCVCLLLVYGFEALTNRFQLTSVLGQYELLSLHLTLFVTTFGMGLLLMYRDLTRLWKRTHSTRSETERAR